jgi:hypothetical protein
MPLPAYLICSEGASLDREANKLTLFNVCEQLNVVSKEQIEQLLKAGRGLIAPTPVRIVTVWMKEARDTSDVRFENQLLFHFPNLAEPMVISQTEFAFTSTFNRVMTPPLFFPPITGPGILKIESRLRRTGETDWIASQAYYIEIITVDTAALNLPSVPIPSTGT